LKGRNSWKIEEGKNNRKKWFFSPDARQGTLMRLRRMRRLLWSIKIFLHLAETLNTQYSILNVRRTVHALWLLMLNPDARQGTLMRLRRMRRLLWLI